MLYRFFTLCALFAVGFLPSAAFADTTISLSPTTGTRDDVFTIQGYGFAPGVAFAQKYVSPAGDTFEFIVDDQPVILTTDESGAFSVTVLPARDFPGGQAGAWTVQFCTVDTADCLSMSLDVTLAPAPLLPITALPAPDANTPQAGAWDCSTPPGFPVQCPFNDLAGSWRQVVLTGSAGSELILTQTGTTVIAGPFTGGPATCKNGALSQSLVSGGATGQGPAAGNTTAYLARWIIGGPTSDTRFGKPTGSDLNGEIAVCYGDQLVMEPNQAHLFRNKATIVLQGSFSKARTGERVSFEFSKR